MFYKFDNDNWNVASKLILPTKPEATEVNSVNYTTFEEVLNDFGWFWSDEEPSEYKEWIEQQEIKIEEE